MGVAVVVLLVLIAMCQGATEKQELPESMFCPGSPYVVAGDRPDPWFNLFATDSTEVRSGPAPDDSVLFRPVPGSVLPVRHVGEWGRLVGADGQLGGWIVARTLRSEPFTRMELRALSRAHRQALRRELMEGMERDSGAYGIRYHPRGAPDIRGLHARHSGPGVATMDSAQRAALPASPFALYADVEEGADSVRLVLVAASRSDQTQIWTQVAMLPDYGLRGDSAWNTRGQLPQELLTRPWTQQRPPERFRFLALAADSLERMRAWRYARLDSAQMRLHEPGCARAYVVPRADRERMRRALRLYELSAAERL